MWLALFLGSLHIVSDLLCTLRENKTVRGMGPKADNIYTVGAGPLQRWNQIAAHECYIAMMKMDDHL